MNCGGKIERVGRQDWPELSQRFLDYNYQQTWAYAEALAERRHAESEHVTVISRGELVGVANVRIHNMPVIGGGIAYIASGPLSRRGDSEDDDINRLTKCLDILHREYVERRGLTLRILAPVGCPAWNARARDAFRQASFAPTDRSRRYRTFLLDIDRTLEEIRSGFSKYWRRNLRRAEKRQFTIRANATGELLDRIRELYRRLRSRKNFQADLDADFYASLQSQLAEGEQFDALVVEHEGEPVAGLIMSMLGDTCIPLVLATHESGLRDYAAYGLQWHSIKLAHARGIRYYDLGGIDAEENLGVYNFKKGMRGVELCAPGPFESTPRGVLAAITNRAEQMYKRFARAA